MPNRKINPGRLKLELFCKGARIHANCRLEEDTRPIKRTRGGLGSGLDAILPGNVWVNIPVAEAFAHDSRYWIDKVNGEYSLWMDTDKVCELRLPPTPTWYEQRTSSGRRMGDIGVMQGTYFAVYPSELCGFWNADPRENCRFCSVGLCYGKTESEEKSVRDVVEAVKTARKHERITFVHFNTGYYENDRALDVIIPYVEAIKHETGLLVGVQCPPAIDLAKYDCLKKAGVDHVSFCFELFDPDWFENICPGKARVFGNAAKDLRNDPLLIKAEQKAMVYLHGKAPHPGQLMFYRALMYSIKLWGKGPVAGEIIAGLEHPEASMAAIDFLADLGAISTVCVFRPCIGIDLEDTLPPEPQSLEPVFARMYEACIRKSIPFGIAPNIRTAMVHLPEEGRWFSENSKGRLAHFLMCGVMKTVFRPVCALKRCGKGLAAISVVFVLVAAGLLAGLAFNGKSELNPRLYAATDSPMAARTASNLCVRFEGLPNLLYAGEKRAMTISIRNLSDHAFSSIVLLIMNNKISGSQAVTIPASSKKLVLFALCCKNRPDGLLPCAVIIRQGSKLIHHKSFTLQNGRSDLSALRTDNGKFYTATGIRVVVVNDYENQTRYRRWAPIKWAISAYERQDAKYLLWMPSGFTGAQEIGRTKVIQYSGNPFASLLEANKHIPAKGAVVLAIGWGFSEAFERFSLHDTIRALDLTIDRARGRNPSLQVALLTPAPIVGDEAATAEYAAAIRKLALDHHAPVIDLHAKMLAQPDWESFYAVDDDPAVSGLYPAEKGKQLIRGWIMEGLE